ncbi:MAG: WG repeat-containing protein [Planctomycetes bacterium]|nr:WG repeat-containing protein [Planctomycetota bacterium]
MNTWRNFLVAGDGTHHLCDGFPVYDLRFDSVLKFHEPGLAPVRLAGRAWHIQPDGQAAYAQRFLETFGFYGGLAAVRELSGWFHIDPFGSPAYSARYSWCGNFQEGLCPVRDQDGRYRHVQQEGKQAYNASWAYAGDFKDGIAVVQRDDGLSSHIDKRGHLAHDRWFLDLRVFHKGFACARDPGGWCHIARDGRPVYTRRFSMMEPFYNGQARVELFDGALEVIEESGNSLVRLRPPRTLQSAGEPEERAESRYRG